MSITVELPPDLAAKVSQLARKRGVDEAAIVAKFTREGLKPTEEIGQDSQEEANDQMRIVTNPISGLLNLSNGRPITREEVQAFLETDE